MPPIKFCYSDDPHRLDVHSRIPIAQWEVDHVRTLEGVELVYGQRYSLQVYVGQCFHRDDVELLIASVLQRDEKGELKKG